MVIRLLVVLVVSMATCEPRDTQAQQHYPANNVSRPLVFSYTAKKKVSGMEVGCQELRSKRYISDGLCTTPRPVNEVICADWCVVPADGHAVEKWRCVDATAKKRRIKLICKDGTRRVYHIKVVKRCKCTRKY